MHHLMSFYWSPDLGDFFFPGLTINGAGPFASLCIVLVVLAVVYEAMKVHSARVRARAARERLRAASCAASETANLLAIDAATGATNGSGAGPRPTGQMLLEAGVFLLHNTLGYALMLSVMLFNGYVFVAVVLGMGLGYFLFGHVSMRVNMENMQARTTKVICAPVCGDQPGASAASRASAFVNEQRTERSCDRQSPTCSSTVTVLQHKPQLHAMPNYQSTGSSQSRSPSGSPTSHSSNAAAGGSCHNRDEDNVVNTSSTTNIIDTCRL